MERMRTKMSGRLGNPKRRRRGKCGSDKASAKRRTDMKRPKAACAAAASPAVVGANGRQAHGHVESLISCECHLSSSLDRRRCAASPQPPDEQEGKENERLVEPDVCSRARGPVEKREAAELMDDGGGPEKITFPDDDSNQILPVEQFFGNLDVVQEYLQRPAATSMRSRREHRRQHFYAPEDSDEDSDEDVCHSDMQCDDRGGS